MTSTAETGLAEPDFEAHARACAGLLGLDLDPAWIGPITANLRVLTAAAGLVAAWPLPDETEAAPVFEA